MEGVAVAVVRWSLVGSVVGDAASLSGIVVAAGGQNCSDSMFWSWMEAVKAMSSNRGIIRNVEEEGGREESCRLGRLEVFVIVVIIIVVIDIRSLSAILSIVAASSDVALLFVVFISGVGMGLGVGWVVVIVIVVDGGCCSCCCRSFMHRRDCMQLMSCWLIVSRSTGACGFVVVAVVVEGRWQREFVSGAGGGVGVRGRVIIVVCCDQSIARICLRRRHQKGNFSMSAATVR